MEVTNYEKNGVIKIFALVVAMVTAMNCSVTNIYAQENNGDAFFELSTADESGQESRINKAGFAYVSGGKNNWGIIIGENNLIGETVQVTNCSGKTINVKAYTEKGTLRNSMTLKAGEVGRAGFYIADGTYNFKVQFADYSAGTITIRMETEWI